MSPEVVPVSPSDASHPTAIAFGVGGGSPPTGAVVVQMASTVLEMAMTIETSSLTGNIYAAQVAGTAATSSHGVSNSATPAVADVSQAPAIDAAELQAAIGQIKTHFAQQSPPQFSLDYLSGLNVMTIKAADTGEVLLQLPDVAALRLARLIKDGGSLESMGLLDTQA